MPARRRTRIIRRPVAGALHAVHHPPAAAVERKSEHPLAQAVVDWARFKVFQTAKSSTIYYVTLDNGQYLVVTGNYAIVINSRLTQSADITDFETSYKSGATEVDEYGEAVSDGVIGEMAEFQDGSAFVWRAKELLATMNIESAIADNISSNTWLFMTRHYSFLF